MEKARQRRKEGSRREGEGRRTLLKVIIVQDPAYACVDVAMRNLLPSIKFRLRITPQKTFFRSFFRSFARRENFSSALNFFSARKFSSARKFGKKNLSRFDRFRPKIVEIGAILAIFEPFES